MASLCGCIYIYMCVYIYIYIYIYIYVYVCMLNFLAYVGIAGGCEVMLSG